MSLQSKGQLKLMLLKVCQKYIHHQTLSRTNTKTTKKHWQREAIKIHKTNCIRLIPGKKKMNLFLNLHLPKLLQVRLQIKKIEFLLVLISKIKVRDSISQLLLWNCHQLSNKLNLNRQSHSKFFMKSIKSLVQMQREMEEFLGMEMLHIEAHREVKVEDNIK